jgi:hypothetical protein
MVKKILLVEPDFPIASKSKNHKNFLPIGLLKLASYHRSRGNKIKLVRGKKHFNNFYPDQIYITSLFTYWSKYVYDASVFYHSKYPKAKIIIGGIYASLMPDDCKKRTKCDKIYVGIHRTAEKYLPAYDLVDVDYQIIHTSRGCFRKCEFCGTWKLESGYKTRKIANYFRIDKTDFIAKKSIINEVKKFYPKQHKLIFYDNNLLHNPYFPDILQEIIKFNEGIKKENNKKKFVKNTQIKPYLTCESQSGFDGRLLDLSSAKLIREAKFTVPRIAWDNSYNGWREIKKQIDMLAKAGYNRKDIFVFVLYNWKYNYTELEKKRVKCYKFGVQIADCRFRPLYFTFDNYKPTKKNQSIKEYYIHPKWTDYEVKLYRQNVRRHNICVRENKLFYSQQMERKKTQKGLYTNLKNIPKIEIQKQIPDVWFPDTFTKEKKHGDIEQFATSKITDVICKIPTN